MAKAIAQKHDHSQPVGNTVSWSLNSSLLPGDICTLYSFFQVTCSSKKL